MYQFFVEPEQIDVAGKSVIIRGNDVNHIKNVLRMRPGEEVAVSNGIDGKEYRCGILALGRTASVWNCALSKRTAWNFRRRSICSRGCPRQIKWNLLFKKQWNWVLFR